jgi:hypothetical protein
LYGRPAQDYLQQVRTATIQSPRSAEHRPYNEDARLATTFINILAGMCGAVSGVMVTYQQFIGKINYV